MGNRRTHSNTAENLNDQAEFSPPPFFQFDSMNFITERIGAACYKKCRDGGDYDVIYVYLLNESKLTINQLQLYFLFKMKSLGQSHNSLILWYNGLLIYECVC